MVEKPKISVYELFILAISVLSLVLLAIDALLQPGSETSAIIEYVDFPICVVFLGDFLYKLASAESRLGYLKWGWLDLISSVPTIDVFRFARIARILRILRVLRGLRSSKAITTILLQKRGQSSLSVAALVCVVVLVFASSAIMRFEVTANGNIQDGADALWWAFVTMTTVGYGDFYPVTPEGRVVAVFLMMAGIGLFGTLTAFIASSFLSPGEEEQERELELIRKELAEIKTMLATRK